MVGISSDAPLRVLIVEDDDGVRALLGVILRRNQIAAELVRDGRSALERLRRERYDVILLDLMLPGVNGFEVIRELKISQPELLARTIVLTAVSDSTLRDFDDAALLHCLIRKPFDLTELVQRVLSCARSAGERKDEAQPSMPKPKRRVARVPLHG